MADSAEQAVEASVRAMFRAYQEGDRATVERLLAPGFRFTSPYDNAIDRAAYFERCWPGHARMDGVDVERVFVQGEEAFVTYLVHIQGGKSFRNTEFMRFAGGQLASVNVYFGESYQGGKFVAQKPPQD